MLYGRAGAGPSHRSQSSPVGTGSAVSGRSLVTQWGSRFGSTGTVGCRPQARDTQTCASLTGPMAPVWISSMTRR